jgi:RNA polymerase sigma factor (sigma-70 family)
MTKKELQQYIWIQDNIQYLENKLLELETEATNTNTKLRDMPKGDPNKGKMENIVCKIIEVREKINDEVLKGYNKICDIERAIEGLEQREKQLVRLRYIEGMKWEKICVEMNYSWRQIHYIHKEILEKLKSA